MKIASALFEEASGSIKDITASRTSAGLTLRNKPLRVHLFTTKQRRQQTVIARASLLWHSLSPAIRQDYDRYARTLTSTNNFNQTYQKRGWRYFCQLYILMAAAPVPVDVLLNRPINDHIEWVYFSPTLDVELLNGIDYFVLNYPAVAFPLFVIRHFGPSDGFRKFPGSFVADYAGFPLTGGKVYLRARPVAGRHFVDVSVLIGFNVTIFRRRYIVDI